MLALAAVVCVFGLCYSDVRAKGLQKAETAPATTTAETPQIFKCEGPFASDASHAKLAKEHGAANLDTEVYWDADGEVTALFPKDPERQLRCMTAVAKYMRRLNAG